METIGEHLKRVRKTCGYSLEDVAQETKINIRYLEAIEKDEFSKLPGELFLRGFLRSYARFLGMNEKEIISRIKEKNKSEVVPSVVQKKEQNRGKELRQKYLTTNNLRVILPVSAGIVVILMMIMLFAGGRNTSTIDSSRQIEEIDIMPAEIEKPENPEQIITRQIDQPAAEPVQLKIYAKELTWIKAIINGVEEAEVLLQPGEVVTWSGEEQITLTIGNAGGVEAEVNGEIQEPLGLRGEVVKNLIVTSKGILHP